jgi:hypothetical protein
MRRQLDVVLYVAAALFGVAIFLLAGATPWVTGKAFAISSPALLTAALATAGMLVTAGRAAHRGSLPAIAGGAQTSPEVAPAPPPRGGGKREAGAPAAAGAPHRDWGPWALASGSLIFVLVAFGVLWSNVLAYHEVTLAPRERLAEIQHIGDLVNGKGPTFVNMYEVYADRHFLRGGAPTEPAEYRSVTLPLRSGAILTKAAWSDLNSFAPSTLEPYRSIVTQRTPAESRPPAIYEPVYRGRYYELWQRPEHPSFHIIEQLDYGEANEHPYCGVSSNGPTAPLCSLSPISIPSCPQILKLARSAQAQGATLIAYQRAAPKIARGDEVRWPGFWTHEPASHALVPTAHGTAVAHMEAPTSQRYELWLSGDFGRGFEVSVDGHKVGEARNELSLFNTYSHVATLFLPAGVHTIEMTFPTGTAFPEVLEPGSGWSLYNALNGIILQPTQFPASELIHAAPAEAGKLCGRPLNWIDVVKSA